MKKIFILLFAIGLITPAFAKISINYTGFPGIGGSYKTIFDSYIVEYGTISGDLFSSMADCFAITNTTQPVFGEGYRNLAVGVTGGVGVVTPPEASAGSATFGDVGIGATAAPFVTISLDPLYSIFGLGIFEDSDLTIKLLPLTIKPKISGNTWTMKFFNMGVILRKRIISPMTLIPVLLSFEGVSVSLGTFYSNNKINGSASISKTERFDYSEGSLTGYVEGTISSLDLEVKTKSFSFDTEVKGYVNLLYILDLFAGFGATLNLTNTFEVNATIPASVKVTITSPTPGTSTDSGAIVISGDDSGKTFIPRLVSGFQINLGPVKIPVQYTYVLGTKNKSYAITFGVTVSF